MKLLCGNRAWPVRTGLSAISRLGESTRYKRLGHLTLYWNRHGVAIEHVEHKTHGRITNVFTLMWDAE